MNKENHMSPDGTSPVTQKRVAIYTRTACDAAGSTALRDQERTCREYAERQNWIVLDEFVRSEQPGKPGLTLESRPKLNSLLRDGSLRPRPFDVLLIKDPERLSRDLKHLAVITNHLHDNGIEWQTVEPELNSNTPNVYNVSFQDAARRTGQIAYDLNFVGAPIFYSWPSNGKMADYTWDETNVTWSIPHLQRFLALLSQNSGAERIHIIAHSMGNRAVCEALKALSYETVSQLKFSHLVLAAPDIDADTFRELASTLQRLSARITLYESSKDKALLASKALHGNPRAGEPFLIIPGLDAIDASAIDTNFLGHSYFSDNYPLLSDIHSILFRDEPAASRFGLHQLQHVDGIY